MGENVGHEYNGQKTTKKNLIQKYTEKLQSSKENKNNPIQKKADLNRCFTFILDIYICLQQYFCNTQKLVTAQMSRLQINKQIIVYSFNSLCTLIVNRLELKSTK